MKLLTKVTSRLHSLARYIKHPELLSVRRSGGLPDIYIALNRPWFLALGIRTVLDIGANQGQFAATMLKLLPDSRVYSFEPLPDCFAQMQAKLAPNARFKGLNVGLAETSAEIQFERNDYSPSSSFLQMSETHKSAFPFTTNSHPVSVRVERLDDCADSLDLTQPLLVKVDVQGYEMKVLAGGEQTIKCARMLIVETSFETLYQGQPLFPEVAGRLADWGFRYAGALDQLTHPVDGRILQADSIFLKL